MAGEDKKEVGRKRLVRRVGQRRAERERERERKVAELLPAVHRPSQEQTLARLFFLVLFIIISPRCNPHTTHWSRVLHHNGGPN